MVLAATNRPWDLDEAIRRRLEKRIYIPLPPNDGRLQLFQINLKGIELGDDINFDKMVEMTDGYSGADIANVCRDAAMMPLRSITDISNIDAASIRPTNLQDFKDALHNVKATVNQNDL